MPTAPPKLKSLATGVSKEARDVAARRGGLGFRGAIEVLERTALHWPPAQRAITSAFHRLYYYNPSRTWSATQWLGHPIRKLPLDAWVYQEIIADVRPGLIIETGTRFGGSALMMANICDLIGHGQVVSVDIAADAQPEHPRVTYVDGSSVDPQIVGKIEAMVPSAEPVMVVLDSDHRTAHVRQELAAYAKLVSVGSYLVVEDTNTGGHPVHNAEVPDEGPMAAVQELMARDDSFELDRARERHFLTYNPCGYLRRVR
jgi:cephalosporin hydroxylase